MPPSRSTRTSPRRTSPTHNRSAGLGAWRSPLLLGACATRGPIVISDCPGFATYALLLLSEILTAAIQREAVLPEAGGAVEAAIAATGAGGAPPGSDALDLLLEDALERAETRAAQQCIIGAALASAAVPLFYQQARVGERAYMDGGVRQSVFEATIAERAALLAVRRAARDGDVAPAILPLYVVRNGPTTVDKDSDISGQADALYAALRTQSIMVNALEVGSIAALRLRFPEGPASLAIADGWELGREAGAPACNKKLHDGRERSGQMFNPTFMQCLQRFGAAKPDRQDPWITLPTVTRIAEARAQDARAR